MAAASAWGVAAWRCWFWLFGFDRLGKSAFVLGAQGMEPNHWNAFPPPVADGLTGDFELSGQLSVAAQVVDDLRSFGWCAAK